MDIGCWIAWCPQHFAGSCSMFWGLRTSNLPLILSMCWLVETDCLFAPEFSHHLVFMGEEHFSKGISPSGRPLSLHGPASSLGESREEAVNCKPLQAFLPFTHHLMVTDMLSCSSEARRTELLFLFFSLSLFRKMKEKPSNSEIRTRVEANYPLVCPWNSKKGQEFIFFVYLLLYPNCKLEFCCTFCESCVTLNNLKLSKILFFSHS